MANWNRHILGLALVKAGALELLQHLADPMAEVGTTVSPSGVLVEVDTGPWSEDISRILELIWRYTGPQPRFDFGYYNLNFKRGLDQ